MFTHFDVDTILDDSSICVSMDKEMICLKKDLYFQERFFDYYEVDSRCFECHLFTSSHFIHKSCIPYWIFSGTVPSFVTHSHSNFYP